MGVLEDRTGTRPWAAAVLTLLGGLWMLTSGGMAAVVRGGGSHGAMDGGQGMMGGTRGTMGGAQGAASMHTWLWHHHFIGGVDAAGWWPVVGSLAGLCAVIIAVLIYAQPRRHASWGGAAIVVSGVGFLTGAGGVIGGLLGVLGGLMAIFWRTLQGK
jgi:hypothetical protein